MTIELISPQGSAGIERYCEALESELKSRGPAVSIRRRPSCSSAFAHFHVGNSGRQLIPLAFRHDVRAVVTLHDVVPRSSTLRLLTGFIQPLLLHRHKLVVHSRFARELALHYGYRDPIDVLPLGWKSSRLPGPVPRKAAPGLRLCQVGVAKKAKAVPQLISAVTSFPNITLTIAGEISDSVSRDALADKGPNVIELGRCSDEVLERVIASSDYVACFRADSVGETNAPLVLAHCLGVPIIGWSIGSIPEYAMAEDRLFPHNTPIKKILASLVDEKSFPVQDRLLLARSVFNYWDESCDRYIQIYRDLGWI